MGLFSRSTPKGGGESRESRQDRVRDAKAKAAAQRKAQADRGRKTDKAIRDDPNRRHPW